MMSRALVLAAAFCTGTLAQDECTASGALTAAGGETFDFCTAVIDMEIFWNYRPNDTPPSVDVLVQSANDGWHSFGFSSGSGGSSMFPAGWHSFGFSSGSGGSSMFPAGVVMACFDFEAAAGEDVNDAADWFIGGRSSPQQAPNNQDLLNFTELQDGACNFRYTRPLMPANADVEQQLGDVSTRTIAAYGGENLSQHASNARVAFDVNFATGENNDASSVHITSATFIIATIGAVSSLML